MSERFREVIKLIQHVFGYAPVTLGEIAEISSGGGFQKSDFAADGRPCIHYGQIFSRFGVTTSTALTRVPEDVFKRSAKAKHGDIIMATVSHSVDAICRSVAWLGNEETAVSGHAAIIRTDQCARYLAHYFHSSSFTEQARRMAQGTTVLHVYPEMLKKIRINLPPIPEQEAIAEQLDSLLIINDLFSGIPQHSEVMRESYAAHREQVFSFLQEELT